MNQHFRQRQFPVGNPLANALVVIVGAIVIGVSVVLGLVAFLILGSIVAVLAGIIGIRVWWMRHRMRGRVVDGQQASARSATETRVIEGEYRVVSGDRRQSDRD